MDSWGVSIHSIDPSIADDDQGYESIHPSTQASRGLGLSQSIDPKIDRARAEGWRWSGGMDGFTGVLLGESMARYLT